MTSIIAGAGHSAIAKTESTERRIRQFESAPCMPVSAPGVALCCKTPGNLRSTFREGDMVRYQCSACGRGHWFAFSDPGDIGIAAAMTHAQRAYEIHSAPASAVGNVSRVD